MDLTISIDPQTDLAQANYPIEEASAFLAVWREAMGSIEAAAAAAAAAAAGISCDTVRTTYGSAHEHDAGCTSHDIGEDGDLEQVLWQMAHDHTHRNADGTWSTSPFTAASRRRLATLIDPLCRDEDIERASKKIDASEDENGSYVYFDDGMRRYYRVDADALAELGAMLRRGTEDAYSHWCAQTDAEEMPEEGARRRTPRRCPRRL